MLNLKNLQKSFGDIQILRDLSFTLESGNSASIRGASGSGKSTLLSLIAGFELPDGGTIHIDDVTLPFASDNAADAFRRDHLGVVFQSFNLLDCLNVWENIAFTARLKGNHDKDFQRTLMNDMAIAHLSEKLPHQLSGGEQQRVAIARALVHKPSLVLADEPTGNLDEETSEQVANTLFAQCRALNTTLIVVTHSHEVAEKADVPLWLHHGQLHVRQHSPSQTHAEQKSLER